jgi:flagellar biosynthesis protein FlhA
MTRSEVNGKVWVQTAKGAVLPIATLLLVMFMIVPVPAIVLDMGFIGNIVISLAVLMAAMNAAKPLDFSSFPIRPAVRDAAAPCAQRRLHPRRAGPWHDRAKRRGHVIEAFGAFPDRRQLRRRPVRVHDPDDHQPGRRHQGRGPRVGSVARFTLDALPGKQMAIDADLAAGLLTADEAKARRREVATEADFYGSMDGASRSS